MFNIFEWIFTTVLWKSKSRRLNPESKYIVQIDDQRVSCRLPSGKIESIEWQDLESVVIETNDSGPLGMDVFFIIVNKNATKGCVIPMGATGESGLLDAIQRLPGFNNHEMIAAMSSTQNRKFLCWKR